jgi:hypothetical protein
MRRPRLLASLFELEEPGRGLPTDWYSLLMSANGFEADLEPGQDSVTRTAALASRLASEARNRGLSHCPIRACSADLGVPASMLPIHFTVTNRAGATRHVCGLWFPGPPGAYIFYADAEDLFGHPGFAREARDAGFMRSHRAMPARQLVLWFPSFARSRPLMHRVAQAAAGAAAMVTVAAAHAQTDRVSFVESEPTNRPATVLLTAGSDFIAPLHRSLIKQLPDTQFVVVVGRGATARAYENAGGNVTVMEYGHPLTSWSQDRTVRLHDGRRPVLASAFSAHLVDGGDSSYELGLADFLGKNRPGMLGRMPDREMVPVSVDRETGGITLNARTPGFFQGAHWPKMYGDGGDRIISGDNMFMGRSTLSKLIERSGMPEGQLERLYGKNIVPVDAAEERDRLDFHIDVFMTPVGDKVLLADPRLGMEALGARDLDGLPAWANRHRFERSLERRERVAEELRREGFEVIPVPVIYATAPTKNHGPQAITMNWNNGIFDGKRFLTASYELPHPGAAEAIGRAEEMTRRAFRSVGITPVFLEGGTAPAMNGGGVRCSAAVLETAPVGHQQARAR